MGNKKKRPMSVRSLKPEKKGDQEGNPHSPQILKIKVKDTAEKGALES